MQSLDDKNRLLTAFKRCRHSFYLVGFFSMCINLLMIVPAIYMLQVYDRVLTSGSHSTLLMLTLMLGSLLITMGALEWVRSRVLVIAGTRLDQLLNTSVFNASFKTALNSGSTGAAQALNDLAGLRQFMSGNALFAFFDLPWVPVYLTVMFVFHPWYGWVGVFSVIILAVITLLNEKLTSARLQEANKMSISSNQEVNKQFANAEVVASMGMLDDMREQWSDKHHKILFWQAKASAVSAVLTSCSKTLRLLLQSLMLGLGALLVIENEMTGGVMIAGSILLGRTLAPLDQMTAAWKGFVSARGQYIRLTELLENYKTDAETMPLSAPLGAVSFESVSVTAPGDKTLILKNISFNAQCGEVVAIIGASASGKSTLVRALLGIWPVAAGCVRLDGADIASWERQRLGPYIGYLPQDVELFDGSIKENIARFGKIDAQEVVKAAELAGVHELIQKLPQGYDTLIGSRGGVLSGGQRQRVALARALYGSPVLIVLDEPNSNLDDMGERALMETLNRLKDQKKTVFLITHKLSVLSSADHVMIMNDGHIQEFAPAREVMAKLRASVAKQPVNIKKIHTAPVNQV